MSEVRIGQVTVSVDVDALGVQTRIVEHVAPLHAAIVATSDDLELVPPTGGELLELVCSELASLAGTLDAREGALLEE